MEVREEFRSIIKGSEANQYIALIVSRVIWGLGYGV